MLFLPPNQQRQSTEGNGTNNNINGKLEVDGKPAGECLNQAHMHV